MLLDAGEGGFCVEAREKHDMVSGEKRRACPHDRTVVIERPRHHHAAVGLDQEQRRHLVIDASGLARDDELWPAGGAA